MRKRLHLLREALRSTKDWGRLRRQISKLTDTELREAEEMELLGRRRDNMLRSLRAERARRAGKVRPPAQMKVESNL